MMPMFKEDDQEEDQDEIEFTNLQLAGLSF